MNGEQLLNALLLSDAGVRALVPAESIVAGILPSSAVPGISTLGISIVDRNVPSPSVMRHVLERVQVTMLARRNDDLEHIRKAVRTALADRRIASMGGVTNIVIHTEPSGGPMVDDEAKFYLRTQDFRVSYNETR